MAKSGVLFSMAPYFFNAGGHYHAYHSGLQEAAEKIGIEAITFIPKNCEVEGLNKQWVSYFDYTKKSRLLRMWMRMLEYPRLTTQLAMRGEEIRVLFLESYSLLDLLALIPAILFFSKKRVHLWHLFRDGLEWCKWKRKIHTLIAKIYRWKLGSHYKAFTDSERIITSLSPLIGIPITLLPIFHTFKTGSKTHKVSREMKLWIPGKLRYDKGTKEILQFAKKRDPNLGKIELWMESNSEFSDLSTPLKIKPLQCGLQRDAYENLFLEVDALLLPYDPVLYVSRSSGPFVEAICAGKMVFTREGNWLAYELRKHNLSECILSWDDPLLPSRIIAVLEDQNVQRKLEIMQHAYKQFHNMDVLIEIIQAQFTDNSE